MKPVAFQVQHTDATAFQVKNETGRMFPHYHTHQELQCTFIEKGNGLLIAADTIEHFNDGDIFLLNSFVPHVFRSEKTVCNVTHLYFDFNTFGKGFWKLNEMSTVVKLLSNENGVIKLHNEKKQKAISLIKQMKDEINFTNLLLFIYFLSLFADQKDLEIISGNSFDTFIDAAESKRMSEVIEYTMRNYANNITLENVASIAGLAIPSFCRYFKKRTNKAYFTFLNEIRINKACTHLRSNNDTIETIAYSCGFSNLSYFNRVFKNQCGMQPKEYRRRMLMKNQVASQLQ